MSQITMIITNIISSSHLLDFLSVFGDVSLLLIVYKRRQVRRQCYSRKILSNLKKIKNKGYGRIIYFAYKISSEIAPAVDTIMHLQVRGSGH